MRKYKLRATKPRRDELDGLSASELKTILKRRGHKVRRDFYKWGVTTKFRSRLYRWRFWKDNYTGNKEFLVDISCPLSEFDRWANSVDYTIKFREYIDGCRND